MLGPLHYHEMLAYQNEQQRNKKVKTPKEWQFTAEDIDSTHDQVYAGASAIDKEKYNQRFADLLNAKIDRLFEKAVECDFESRLDGGTYDPHLRCFDMKTIAKNSKRVILIPLEPIYKRVSRKELETAINSYYPEYAQELLKRILEHGLEPK